MPQYRRGGPGRRRGEVRQGLRSTHESQRRVLAGSVAVGNWQQSGQQGLKDRRPKPWTESRAREVLQRRPVSEKQFTNSGVKLGERTREKLVAAGGPNWQLEENLSCQGARDRRESEPSDTITSELSHLKFTV